MSNCPQSAYNYIATIVNDDDIVPTMTVKNAYDLVKPVISFTNPTVSGIVTALKTTIKVLETTSMTKFGKEFYNNTGNSLDKVAENVILFHKTPNKFNVRYVSGTTYHLKKDKKVLSNCIVNPANTLNSISITLTCISNHELNKYNTKIGDLSK